MTLSPPTRERVFLRASNVKPLRARTRFDTGVNFAAPSFVKQHRASQIACRRSIVIRVFRIYRRLRISNPVFTLWKSL
jgi:hypothetical protein